MTSDFVEYISSRSASEAEILHSCGISSIPLSGNSKSLGNSLSLATSTDSDDSVTGWILGTFGRVMMISGIASSPSLDSVASGFFGSI